MSKGHKEYKYLYKKMLDEEVIRKAYENLRRGKTKRREIQLIDQNLDAEVTAMREMIRNTRPCEVERPEFAYKPKRRTPRFIHEHGKTRKIYMPGIHEQWLHHIIVEVLSPIITATSYPYSCGSFPKRGAHYGKRQLKRWLNAKYYAKLDIRHFYDNIRHDVLMRELSVRIKDDWFLYIIRLCLKGFRKGIPLGFYISQWLANYLLEPLDKFVTETLGIKKYIRYMDDMVLVADNKRKLHSAVKNIKIFLGRYRLKLKRNHQVCRFDYVKKDGRHTGRPIDFMGFVFCRDRIIIRKSIMLSATRLAAKMRKAKESGRRYYTKHIRAMLSYAGWFTCTDTYGCYETYIKSYVNIGKLKKIISKLKRRQNDETVERRTLLCGAGRAAAYS